jgi:hypothetical protein
MVLPSSKVNFAGRILKWEKLHTSRTDPKEEQEIAILALHLLQICLVYINTLLVQKVLSEQAWLEKMQQEDFRGLTPLFYGHVNPYGRLVLDMNERIMI